MDERWKVRVGRDQWGEWRFGILASGWPLYVLLDLGPYRLTYGGLGSRWIDVSRRKFSIGREAHDELSELIDGAEGDGDR